MIELHGKYNRAKIFATYIDKHTIAQITALCNQEIYQNSKIRIMPDCHAGVGCVIGTTMEIKDSVSPNLVGIDIGCGMLAIKIKEKRVDLPKFDSVVKSILQENENNRNGDTRDLGIDDLICKSKRAPLRVENAYNNIGALGGGNHFVELGRDSEGCIWLIIHTGSRHLGIEVCEWYQKQGYLQLKAKVNGGTREEKERAFINKLKRDGKQRDIEDELKVFRKTYKEDEPSIPYELCYCTGELLKEYIHDMQIVQEYASINRSEIAKMIIKKAKLHEIDRIETVHNYIDTENMILRKGAISAKDGEKVIIPINMRDGSLICTGKGNPDWNYSAPHGAGRLFSRSETKSRVSLPEFKAVMKEAKVYSSSINSSTLDESPMAYKGIKEIMDNITDTVDVIDIIKPIYNFKLGSLGKD